MIPHFFAETISIGSLELPVPGVLLSVGLLFGSLVSVRSARTLAIAPDAVTGFLPWLFAGLLLGSHLGELLFYHPHTLTLSTNAILGALKGKSSVGAFIGAGTVGWLYLRAHNIRASQQGQQIIAPLRFLDVMLYGLTVGWIFGRMGCFAIHDHPGIETHFWLGVQGICPSRSPQIACHDLGLYEAVAALAIFLGATLLTFPQRHSGHRSVLIITSYALSRLFLDSLRHPLTDIRYFGWTPGQFAAAAMLGIALWLTIKFRRASL